MGQVKKPVLILGIVGMLLLMAVFGLLVFQYIHIKGFQSTMEVLVDTASDGKYALDIGDTRIDYWNFSFSMDNLVVRKTNPNDTIGVIQVRIPDVIIDLGPIRSTFTGPQFKVDQLTFNEPVATIGLKESQKGDTVPKFEPVNIPQQIAKFYPAVETILEHFNVKHFEIKKAGLKLEKSDTSIQLSLLDLLITNWNMRNLSDSARFHLALGDQEMRLTSSDFSFHSIVWDFQRKELDILDYSYTQTDTSEREVIHLEGKSIRIVDLDYQKLVSEAYYDFQRLLIVEPKVTVHIYPNRKKFDRSVHPLSDILNKHFGTLEIHDGEILDASLDMTIYREPDTMSLHLPRMNLFAKEFEVNENSVTLLMDELSLDIHETELDLGSDWAFQFKNLRYDKDHNALFDSVKILKTGFELPVLDTRSLDLFNFNVFHFIYDNEITIDSIKLAQAVIRGNDQLVNSNSGQKSKTGSSKTPTLNIGRISLDQVDINASLDQTTSRVRGLSGVIDNFSMTDQVSYAFRYFKSPFIKLVNPEAELELRQLWFQSNRLQLARIVGNYRGLDIQGSDLLINHKKSFLDQPPVNHFDLVSIRDISLSGNLEPSSATSQSKNPKQNQEASLQVDHLNIDRIKVNLSLNDTTRVTSDFGSIEIQEAKWNHKRASYQKFQAAISSANYQSGQTSYAIGPAEINNKGISSISDVTINQVPQEINLGSITMGPFNATNDSLDIEWLLVNEIKLLDSRVNRVSSIDSIRINNYQMSDSTQPVAGEILVYSPQIKLPKKSGESKKQPARSYNPVKAFSSMRVSPGELIIGDNTISFDSIQMNPMGSWLDLDLENLAFKTRKSSIHVGSINSDESSLYIDSTYVVPVNDYVERIETETDILSAEVDHIAFRQVQWDSLLNSGRLIVDEMQINNFDLSIKRDKTLPDPPPVDKPYLLQEFIPSVETARIPKITGDNGKVVYMEVGEKTSKEGHVMINDIQFTMFRDKPTDQPAHVSYGNGLIYGKGRINYDYHRLDSGRFSLDVKLVDMPLDLLNQMVDPLQAAKITSGYLHNYEFSIVGDNDQASGQSVISYDDLHVEIFKSHTPDVSNLGSTLLTLLVDKILLKHSKYQATADFTQERIKFKGPINYWVKSGIHGAAAAVMKGKQDKKTKRAQRRASKESAKAQELSP